MEETTKEWVGIYPEPFAQDQLLHRATVLEGIPYSRCRKMELAHATRDDEFFSGTMRRCPVCWERKRFKVYPITTVKEQAEYASDLATTLVHYDVEISRDDVLEALKVCGLRLARDEATIVEQKDAGGHR